MVHAMIACIMHLTGAFAGYVQHLNESIMAESNVTKSLIVYVAANPSDCRFCKQSYSLA